MEVQARSFRGFSIVGRGVTQETADRARARVEALLEEQGVTAADIQGLTDRYLELGTAGVDLQRLSAADYRRYGIDPKHANASKRLHEVLQAARKLGSVTPCSYLGFKAGAVAA